MGRQVSPVFDALEDQARKHPRNHPLVYEGAHICQQAAKHHDEIQSVRQHRDVMRRNAFKIGKRNGAFVSGDIHWLELEAINLLEPETKIANAEAQTKAWQRVFKQPWGKEFLNAPYEKKRF